MYFLEPVGSPWNILKSTILLMIENEINDIDPSSTSRKH